LPISGYPGRKGVKAERWKGAKAQMRKGGKAERRNGSPLCR